MKGCVRLGLTQSLLRLRTPGRTFKNTPRLKRFVTLDECDYVIAARYRDYDQHSTRASKVVQGILETKEQWQTVRPRARSSVEQFRPRNRWNAED